MPTRDLIMRHRRWLIAAAIGITLIAVWSLVRRGPASAAVQRGAEEKEPVTDSVVTLDSAAQRFAGIELVAAGTVSADAVMANGTVAYNANRASVIAPRVEARVIIVRADLGQRVDSGSTLAVLESQEVAEVRQEQERARAALDVAQQNFERAKRLYQESISSQKAVLTAEGEYRAAQAELNGATAKLRSIGATDGEGGSFSIVSPVAGTVLERNVMPGQIAGPETSLFTVADLGRLWITVDVYENDVARIREGAAAQVTPRALPGETFVGRVTFAGGVVDTVSRTIKVRVEIQNSSHRLRPGMFAQVRIDAPTAVGSRGMIAVPELAVQDLSRGPVVFVPGGSPGEFVARRVVIGNPTGGGMVTIAAGLRPGEMVVVKGAFQLKSELLKATFGEEGETP